MSQSQGTLVYRFFDPLSIVSILCLLQPGIISDLKKLNCIFLNFLKDLIMLCVNHNWIQTHYFKIYKRRISRGNSILSKVWVLILNLILSYDLWMIFDPLDENCWIFYIEKLHYNFIFLCSKQCQQETDSKINQIIKFKLYKIFCIYLIVFKWYYIQISKNVGRRWNIKKDIFRWPRWPRRAKSYSLNMLSKMV